MDESPYVEIIAGLRALGPLILFLYVVLKVLAYSTSIQSYELILFLYVVLKILLREELPLVRASVVKENGAEQVQ
jgi:hypothetical protein